MTLRTFLFWPHLCAGILAGAVIVLMSITGVLLTYERQMIAWSDRQFRSSPEPGAAPLSIDALVGRLRTAHPGLDITALTFAADPDAPVTVAVPQRTLYADAYSGRLLGESSPGVRQFMSRLRSWHRWLAVDGDGRPLARAITGWSNVLFLFIVLSGLYLWLPRRWSWQRVRAVALFNGQLRGKARDFNWHNVIGFWSAVPLFIVVLSAAPISFPWANALLYRAVGEAPPAGRGGGAGAPRTAAPRADAAPEGAGTLGPLFTRAAEQVPGWTTINVRIPDSAGAPVVFAIDRGDGGQPQLRSTLTLDAATGAVIAYDSFADQTLGRRLRSIARFAHTGEVLGMPGQTVAGLASAGAVVLGWTGFALALRRFRAWVARRGTRGAADAERRQSTAA
jgi:uncharacterized iron-regulated membrane protein